MERNGSAYKRMHSRQVNYSFLTFHCFHCAEIQHNFSDSFPLLMKGMILSKEFSQISKSALRIWIYSLPFAFLISPITSSASLSSAQHWNLLERVNLWDNVVPAEKLSTKWKITFLGQVTLIGLTSDLFNFHFLSIILYFLSELFFSLICWY